MSIERSLSRGVPSLKTVVEEVEFFFFVCLFVCTPQIACLSCCSVLRERASGGSDVGGRLLSTPSRLFRHTGQVSCCDGKKKKRKCAFTYFKKKKNKNGRIYRFLDVPM